jgi:hypothetical protein
MFYCQPCAAKNDWPHFYGMPLSRGPCEECGKQASCVDVPSASLKRRTPPLSEQES